VKPVEKKTGGDFDKEFRNMYVSFLIKNITVVENYLFFEGDPIHAILPLRGLISSLDSDSKEILKEQRNQLKSFEENTNLCSAEKMYKIYDVVMSYLMDTYLLEFRRKRLEKTDLDKLEDKPGEAS